ncbi:MAG: hypothetical protein LUH14_09400 [Clostridiaceae bacterium]|nr:hypothetical protein [Clostridiaceae bacterium]
MERIIIFIVLLVGLLAVTYTDVKGKKIFLPVCMGEMVILLTLNFCWKKGSVFIIIASFGICALFYLVSVATRGQIGKGDAFLFGMTGAGVGLAENLLLIYLTFLFAFAGGLFLLMLKKVSMRDRLPMAPFVLAAYLVLFFTGGG